VKRSSAYTDLVLFKRLLREARPYWRHIAVIFVISMLAAPLTLLTPVPLKIAVDSVLGSHPVPGFLDALLPAGATRSDTAILVVVAAMFVLVAVLTQMQDLGSTLLKTYTGERLVLRFRSKLFQHIQRLSLAYHDRIGTADSTYRIQYDAMSLQYVAVESVISLITAVSTLGAMLYVTYRIDRELALVALVVSPPILLVAKTFRPRMRAVSREVKKLESGALSVVQEVLTGLRVVKAFGQEDREQERFAGRFGEGMRARIRLVLIEGAYSLLIGGTIAAGGAVVLFVGVRHVQSGTLTLGDLLLVMGYLTQLYAPLKTMARKAGSLQNYLASAERAFGILDETPEVSERAEARSIDRASGAIEFRDVSFAYDPERPVLENVSFVVEPGQRVGIAGPSGAGKTTLMNVLCRFYDPTSGQILLDGVDLRDCNVADLRKQFGIVLQEPVLFSTSIAENIAYARPSASYDDIREAARSAGADDFILSLPEGYATLVGERGMRLSGGERQRISLARAFLKDAPILILDEPTSSVDVATETLIMEAMDRLMSGRTSFMIAHRLGTLELCERRLEIDHGRLSAPDSTAEPAVSPIVLNGRAKTGASNGKSAARRGDLERHPAVEAWRRFRPGSEPRGIAGLARSKLQKKSAAFRLEGCGPEGGSVIAKLCKRKAAEVENAVHGDVLPALPISSLAYYGMLDEGGPWCWIFLEDGGEEPYSPLLPKHRKLVAEWLAGLHGAAAAEPAVLRLPSRGPEHYLTHLRSAQEALFQHLCDRAPRGDELRVLTRLTLQLETLESRWGDVTALCEELPRTLVHGDLSRKNLRIRPGETGAEVVAFDWEKAGWGIPAVDLARLRPSERRAAAEYRESGEFASFCVDPCAKTYHAALRDGVAYVDEPTVKLMAVLGNVLRCVATVDWVSRGFTPDWTPVADLRVCSLWLSNAMKANGWQRAHVAVG
jgi:ATP-binding cassette, subfamily B, bacterial